MKYYTATIKNKNTVRILTSVHPRRLEFKVASALLNSEAEEVIFKKGGERVKTFRPCDLKMDGSPISKRLMFCELLANGRLEVY